MARTAAQTVETLGTTPQPRKRRRRRNLSARPGAGTGVGSSSINVTTFGAMHKAAGHDLWNFVQGYCAGKGIPTRLGVQYLNTAIENS